jgi:simple sugar transport system substrate-binding protein
MFDAKKQAIVAGSLSPFAGPIKDNTGAIKVQSGSELSMDDLLAINWYAEGVDGTVPK